MRAMMSFLSSLLGVVVGTVCLKTARIANTVAKKGPPFKLAVFAPFNRSGVGKDCCS